MLPFFCLKIRLKQIHTLTASNIILRSNSS
uniref:Uncharacterized protein n=1 Tax=Arundo donax TaxID=35708 RepID=A0A0A9GZH7_ARUDO